MALLCHTRQPRRSIIRWGHGPEAVTLVVPVHAGCRTAWSAELRKSASVVVVGGGCMGASVAYHLSRNGLTDVLLVEREPLLATASTGRNAGGVRHQFSNEANVRLSIESIALFENFEAIVGSPIDFHQDGYLFLLSTPGSVDAFRASAGMQRRLGVRVDWLSPESAARRAPGLDVEGVIAATFCSSDGIADPNGVTMGFARAAQSAGVEICRETEALAIDVRDGRVRGVLTSRGRVETSVVVDAAGAWAGSVGAMAGIEVPIRPLRRHIFIAQPPGPEGWIRLAEDGSVLRLAPDSRIMVIDFDSSFYFHREGANVLFGMGDPGEEPGFDTTVRWDLLPEVVEVAVRRLPVLSDASVSHAWAGLYEMTPDAMPVIGPVATLPGFFVIAGFSGHGFQHCPAAGRILADLITGSDPGLDVAPFALERFVTGIPAGEGHFV
jgi:sarcosine oxidase subunit beta